DDRRGPVRAHPAQTRLPRALPRERAVRVTIWCLLRRLERRIDARPARRGRDERDLDGDRGRARLRPEGSTAEAVDRCARGLGPRRTRHRYRRRSFVDPRHQLRKERTTMTEHATGTREEWLAARLELLAAEKEHTLRSDELAQQRRALPWVRLDKDYRFETHEGGASLA